jgi:hypothetical protein
MGDFVAFFAFFGTGAWLIYLIFGVLRRRQQDAMQKHLLDKFSSTKDFAEFVQSPAGQKYVAGFSETVTKPGASILNSMRIGIVLIFVGGGFFMVRTFDRNAHYLIQGVATLISMLGLGFLVSAVVSYLIAKRIGSELTK